MPLGDVLPDTLKHPAIVGKKLGIQFLNGKRAGGIGKRDGLLFAGQGGEPLGGRPTGFAGAENIGVPAGGSLFGLNFEVITELALLRSVGEPVWLVAVLRKKRKHRVRAHLVNAAHHQTAQADPVGEKLDVGFDLNFIKRDPLPIGQRGCAKLPARGGKTAFVVAGERKIVRLREEFDAGKQLRQKRLPVLAPISLLELGLERSGIHFLPGATNDSERMISGALAAGGALVTGAVSSSSTSSG